MSEHANAGIKYPFIIPSFVLLYFVCMYGNHINCSVVNSSVYLIPVTATKKYGDFLRSVIRRVIKLIIVFIQV